MERGDGRASGGAVRKRIKSSFVNTGTLAVRLTAWKLRPSKENSFFVAAC